MNPFTPNSDSSPPTPPPLPPNNYIPTVQNLDEPYFRRRRDQLLHDYDFDENNPYMRHPDFRTPTNQTIRSYSPSTFTTHPDFQTPPAQTSITQDTYRTPFTPAVAGLYFTRLLHTSPTEPEEDNQRIQRVLNVRREQNDQYQLNQLGYEDTSRNTIVGMLTAQQFQIRDLVEPTIIPPLLQPHYNTSSVYTIEQMYKYVHYMESQYGHLILNPNLTLQISMPAPSKDQFNTVIKPTTICYVSRPLVLKQIIENFYKYIYVHRDTFYNQSQPALGLMDVVARFPLQQLANFSLPIFAATIIFKYFEFRLDQVPDYNSHVWLWGTFKLKPIIVHTSVQRNPNPIQSGFRIYPLEDGNYIVPFRDESITNTDQSAIFHFAGGNGAIDDPFHITITFSDCFTIPPDRDKIVVAIRNLLSHIVGLPLPWRYTDSMTMLTQDRLTFDTDRQKETRNGMAYRLVHQIIGAANPSLIYLSQFVLHYDETVDFNINRHVLQLGPFKIWPSFENLRATLEDIYTRYEEEFNEGTFSFNRFSIYIRAVPMTTYDRLAGTIDSLYPLNVNTSPSKKSYIRIDPVIFLKSKRRNPRINLTHYKMCLITSLWLGLDPDKRFKTPPETWNEASRSWFYTLSQREGTYAQLVIKNQSGFNFDRVCLFISAKFDEISIVERDVRHHWVKIFRRGKIYAKSPKLPRLPRFAGKDRRLNIEFVSNHACLLMNRKRNPQLEIFDTKIEESRPHPQYRITLPPINYPNQNYSIGVFDFESYPSEDTREETVFMVGFTFDYKYYAWTKQTCLRPIAEFAKHLMDWKYDKMLLYAHNGSGFDFKLLLADFIDTGWIFKGRAINGPYDSIGRVSLYHPNVKKEINYVNAKGKQVTRTKYLTITLSDSMMLLPGKLSNITKGFNVTHAKLDFDTLSVTHLNYQEKTDEMLKYLKYDCMGLYEVLTKFDKVLQDSIDTNIRNSPTTTSLSISYFLRKFYDITEAPIFNVDIETEAFIKKAYFGGRTEAFYIGHFKAPPDHLIASLDINSSYPFQCTKDLPCGQPFFYSFPQDFIPNSPLPKVKGKREYFKQKFLAPRFATSLLPKSYTPCYENFEETFFGVMKCKVATYPQDEDIPLLGCRYNERLVFPWVKVGKQQDFYITSIEYDFIQQHNLPYTIKPIEGYHFKRVPFARKFMLENYKIRKQKGKIEGDKFMDVLYKLIMNSWYGRTAMRRIRPSICFYHSQDQDYLMKRFNYRKNLIAAHRYKNQAIVKTEQFADVNMAAPQIATFVTAYGRMQLYEGFMAVKKVGGKVLYCDTDSILFSFHKQKPPQLPVNKELGGWDWEGKWNNTVILGLKCYCHWTDNHDATCVKSGCVKFKSLMFNNEIIHQVDCRKGYPCDNCKTVKENFDCPKDSLCCTKKAFKGMDKSVLNPENYIILARGDWYKIQKLSMKSGQDTYFRTEFFSKIFRPILTLILRQPLYRKGWVNGPNQFVKPLFIDPDY